jgi:GT2 family glycosyltransferase
VVPFRGGQAALDRLLLALSRLELRDGDEAIVADNTKGGSVTRAVGERAQVVRAAAERSSYHARNAGAALASRGWLLFVDADCVPRPGLLDEYFAEPIAAGCGAVAGSILGDPAQRGLVARYARSRHFLSADHGLLRADSGTALTGNLLVRREAFAATGGFVEGIRSGGDIDFSRRLRAAGWSLERRRGAAVEHLHRESLLGLLGMIARYGAGARWLNQRYPGSSPRWPLGLGLRGTVRDVAGLVGGGELEPAVFRAIDGLGLIAHNLGYVASNRARR